jgi:phosphopantetheine adenylyltransferase
VRGIDLLVSSAETGADSRKTSTAENKRGAYKAELMVCRILGCSLDHRSASLNIVGWVAY